jgi:hypothetical protein
VTRRGLSRELSYVQEKRWLNVDVNVDRMRRRNIMLPHAKVEDGRSLRLERPPHCWKEGCRGE